MFIIKKIQEINATPPDVDGEIEYKIETSIATAYDGKALLNVMVWKRESYEEKKNICWASCGTHTFVIN